MTRKEYRELLVEAGIEEEEEIERQIQEGTYRYMLDGPVAAKYNKIRKEIFARYEREKEENDDSPYETYIEVRDRVLARRKREKEEKKKQNSDSNT